MPSLYRDLFYDRALEVFEIRPALKALLFFEIGLARKLFSEKEIRSWFEIENNLGLCDYFTGKILDQAKEIVSRSFGT